LRAFASIHGVLRARLLTVLAVPALAAGALAGCGTASGPSSDDRAPVKSDALAKLVSDVKGSLQKSADTTAQANSVTLRFTGTSDGKKVSGAGLVSFKPSKIEMTVDDGTDKTTIRIIGTTFYVQIPPKERAGLKGKTWLKLDAPEAYSGTTSQAFQDVDPVKQIKTLLSGEDVTAVGQEEINGVRTVHYKAEVPVDKYLAQMDAKTRAAAKRQLESAGADAMDIDVWVDEQYRPLRLHLVVGTKTDMTMDYADYGKPVHIVAPPAKDTMDVGDMLKNID
jgi:hypothetical protein